MKFRRLALALLLLGSVFFAFAEGEQENQENPLNKKLDTRGLLPLLAKDIEEGSYEIETASSSSMFKIEKTVLYVKDNAMTADITLSGKGYSNVTMLSAADSEGLTSLEGTTAAVGKDGKYVFTLPVQSLNTELVCSAFSKKKQKWYERRVVFYSEKNSCGKSFCYALCHAKVRPKRRLLYHQCKVGRRKRKGICKKPGLTARKRRDSPCPH